jgi:ribosome maturation factor RimP
VIKQTAIEVKIHSLISPPLVELGYLIVRVKVINQDTLQIMIERLDGEMLTVKDCTKVSKAITSLADAQDIIYDCYDLEVSSPGIDRPLMTLEDFQKYVGHEIQVVLNKDCEGQKKFKAKLHAVETRQIIMEVISESASKIINVLYENIDTAKLSIK